MKNGRLSIQISSAIFIATLFCCNGCTCSRSGESNAQAFKPRHFPMVQAPVVMEDQNEKLSYIAKHFWDAFIESAVPVHSDTTLAGGVPRPELEQAMSNYSVLLGQLPLDEARADIDFLVCKMTDCERRDTSLNVFETLSSLVQRYLYDPNSPFRDEDIYNAFASAMAESDLAVEAERIAFADEARRSALNSRGTKAADFSFSDRWGKVYSLYGIKADYIVLFFSNPGCHACKEIIDALNGNPVISDHIADGSLAVLNIYIDEKLDEWYEYMPIYPDSWYNGYDHNYLIRGEELYDVRAIPSLYFLDKSKVVLLKDAPLEKLLSNLPWQ